MSEYTQALAELASLPRRLEQQLAQAEREAAAERARREREIAAVAAEHEAVVSRLETMLERARNEGVAVGAGRAGDAAPGGEATADPVEYARQLVERLEQALDRFVYTRDALAAEETKLDEEERRRAAEERRRREQEEARRRQLREDDLHRRTVLSVGLGALGVVGLAVGLTNSPAALALPALAVVAVAALWLNFPREK